MQQPPIPSHLKKLLTRFSPPCPLRLCWIWTIFCIPLANCCLPNMACATHQNIQPLLFTKTSADSTASQHFHEQFPHEVFADSASAFDDNFAFTLSNGKAPTILPLTLSESMGGLLKNHSPDFLFQDENHSLLSYEQLLTPEFHQKAKQFHPIQLLSSNSETNPREENDALDFSFQHSPWHQLEQFSLYENLFEELSLTSAPPALIAPAEVYGFRNELGEMSSGSFSLRQFTPSGRMMVIGDSADMKRYSTTNPFNTTVARQLDTYPGQVLPRVGVKYEIYPEQITGYYLFDQYSPQGGEDGFIEDNFLISPFGGDNHRAGLQAHLLDGRWMVQASSFYSEADTASTFVPSPFYDWSRGVELSIQAKVTTHWKTTLRFTEVESRISSPQGSADWAPPQRSSTAYSTLWNRYNLISNEKETLTIGLGTRISSSYRKSYANSLLLPGYSRWDLGLFYQREQLEFRFYVKSILDRDYYSSFNYLMNSPDSPLSIDAQLHYRY